MSHTPQRIEKDCLNCGTFVQGHYCHHCGQENVVPKETFWHMVTHFFYDITHFDSSFFNTLKDLLFRPGFLTKEYMKGRRKSYLHPVRMYVFTSAVFFLVFFSLYRVNEADINITNGVENKNPGEKNSAFEIDTITTKDKGVRFNMGNANQFKTVHEYDSIQKSLPKNKRDNWIVTLINRKGIALNQQYKGRENTLLADLANKFIHTAPYILFASLPLFALFLKLFYLRKKQFYYADHAIFLIHLYIFTFLFMLMWFLLDKLNAITNWSGTGVIQTILVFLGLFYTLKALKNFYAQGWGKTILKFILFNVFCIIAALILFAFFGLFSFYQI